MNNPTQEPREPGKAWPPRVWVNPARPIAAWTTDESKSLGNVEYISKSEHEAILAAAVAKAYEQAADSFRECGETAVSLAYMDKAQAAREVQE